MAAIVDVRDALIANLQADPRLAGVTVTYHGGDFDLEALKRYAKKTPALVVTVLDFATEDEGGSVVANVTWGAVGLAVDRAGAPRTTAILDVADAASRAIHGAFHGYSGQTVSKPRKVSARNEYSAALDKLGVAMWGIAWEQRIDLADDPGTFTYDDLLTVAADYDLSPRPAGEALGTVPEATDAIDIIQDP